MSKPTQAYLGTSYIHNPPHMMVIAQAFPYVLLIGEQETDPQGKVQTIAKLPGRDLVYVRGSVLDSEYMYAEGLNYLALGAAAKAILKETNCVFASAPDIEPLVRDQRSLLTPDHETIVCLATVSNFSRSSETPKMTSVSQKEILDNGLSFEEVQFRNEMRQKAQWVDLRTLFENLTRAPNAQPFLEEPGVHAFNVHGLSFATNRGATSTPITTPTVAALQALARINAHFKKYLVDVNTTCITGSDKKAITEVRRPTPAQTAETPQQAKAQL